MSKLPPISHCIGDYDAGDAVCDGDPASSDSAEQAACSWQARCAAFRRHLKRTGRDIEQYVEPAAVEVEGETFHYAKAIKGAKMFAAFCDRLIVNEAKREVKKTKRAEKAKTKAQHDKRRDGPSPKAKRAARKALRKRAHSRRQKLIAMFDVFRGDLVEQLEDREFAPAGQAIPPGRLFVVDRSLTSGYMSVYCQTAQSWNAPLITLKFRTASFTFEAELPVEVEVLRGSLSKTMFKRLSPEPVGDGKFKSSVRKVGKMELGLLAEVIAQLVKGGRIELPAA